MEGRKLVRVYELQVAQLKRELEIRELEATGTGRSLKTRLVEALRREGEDPETYLFEVDREEETSGGESQAGESQEERDRGNYGVEQTITQMGERMNLIMETLMSMREENKTSKEETLMNMKEEIKASKEETLIKIREEVDRTSKELKEEVLQLGKKTEEKLNEIQEKFGRNIKEMQEKQEELDGKQKEQEAKIENLHENIATEVKKGMGAAINTIAKETTRRTEKKIEENYRNIVSNGKTLTILETRIEEGISKNLEIMDEELGKLRWEIKKDNKETKEVVENIKQNIEKKGMGEEDIKKWEEDMKKNREEQTLWRMTMEEQWKTQSAERMTIMQPLAIGSCPVDDNVKFNGNITKIHPKTFITVIKNKVKRCQNFEDTMEIVRRHLTEQAQTWFTSKESQFKSLEDFEKAFLTQYWGEINQGYTREKLYFGKFKDGKKSTMYNYALQIYTQAQFLDPAIREEEIIMYLSRHFRTQIAETIAVLHIKTFNQLSDYIMRVERNLNIRMDNDEHRHNEQSRYDPNNRLGNDNNDIYSNNNNRYNNNNTCLNDYRQNNTIRFNNDNNKNNNSGYRNNHHNNRYNNNDNYNNNNYANNRPNANDNNNRQNINNYPNYRRDHNNNNRNNNYRYQNNDNNHNNREQNRNYNNNNHLRNNGLQRTNSESDRRRETNDERQNGNNRRVNFQRSRSLERSMSPRRRDTDNNMIQREDVENVQVNVQDVPHFHHRE